MPDHRRIVFDMPMPVPATLDDVTSEWLDHALRDSGVIDVEVQRIDVVPLPPGHGLLGDLARAHVWYARGSGPASFIVKLPASEPGSRQVGLMLRAWAREVAFYRHAAPRSPGARLPRCYATCEDVEQGRWAIVLEDCAADPVDPAVGATTAQAEAAVDALAAFHAVWWESGVRYDWMPGFDSTGVGGLQPAWLDALPVFLERYGHVVPEPAGDWVLRFAPRLADWSVRAAGEPLTMVHADYRIDNLIFRGDEVTIIDWQTALRGPAAMDLSCFVTTGLTIGRRRELEAGLIERYLAQLLSAGVAVDQQVFLRSYDETMLWWMGQFGNNLARLHPGDAAVQQRLDTMIERVYTAALDRDVGRLLD